MNSRVATKKTESKHALAQDDRRTQNETQARTGRTSINTAYRTVLFFPWVVAPRLLWALVRPKTLPHAATRSGPGESGVCRKRAKELAPAAVFS